MRTIEIIVAPSGETRIQVKGFGGAACLDATRQLEAALGRKTNDRLTAEFHSPVHEEHHLRTGGDGAR